MMSKLIENSKIARPVTPLGILAQKLESTVQMAEKDRVSSSLMNSLLQVLNLASGIDPYLEKCTTSESPALKALAQKTAAEDWSKRFWEQETICELEQEMLSGHIEGQALKFFVNMTKAKRILEVGMFTGYSALAMAEALPDDGIVLACEVDQYVADFARACFNESPHGNKIKIEIAPALETLQSLANSKQSFDLIFIDADKKEYIDYFKLLLDQELLSPNGFILVDNTLLQGQPYLPTEQRSDNGEAIAQFNQFVANDPRVEQVLLPLRDGLTIIRRN